MRLLIATVKIPFLRGGAELHAEGLLEALRAAGHEAEIVTIPFKWYPPERIPDHMLACRLLDLTNFSGIDIDQVIGLKFPAYYVRHPNKVLWILHQHRQAYDLWDRPDCDLKFYPNGAEICGAIRTADRELIPEAKAVFTNSQNVSARLKRYCEIESVPLYHPPGNAERFFCSEPADYFFFPSRISSLKRQRLVLEALAATHHPVRVRFAGTPEYPPDLDELKKLVQQLKLDRRVAWLGWITEDQKLQDYACALGVLYPPLDEDYGYVTLEAMLSAKPVITCTDSGGPNEFVLDGETGFVVEPSAEALAAAMDNLWENRQAGAQMGLAGREYYASLNISWRTVVRSLLA